MIVDLFLKSPRLDKQLLQTQYNHQIQFYLFLTQEKDVLSNSFFTFFFFKGSLITKENLETTYLLAFNLQ